MACIFLVGIKRMKSQSIQCGSSSTSLARALWRERQFNPSGAACPGFPARSRCCWTATLYQFPHEEPPRRSSRETVNTEELTWMGSSFAGGINCPKIAGDDWTRVGLWDRTDKKKKMPSGLGLFSMWTVSRSVMAEVQWIAGLPSSLVLDVLGSALVSGASHFI